MKKHELVLSTLGHTWIFDLDGTLVKHNGYLEDGADTPLSGAMEFLRKLPEKDMIILLTSRDEKNRRMMENFLDEEGIRYDHIIFNAPYGERILVNDDKPSGLCMSYAVSAERDQWCDLSLTEDRTL